MFSSLNTVLNTDLEQLLPAFICRADLLRKSVSADMPVQYTEGQLMNKQLRINSYHKVWYFTVANRCNGMV